jgi:hypothetical protein
MNFTLLSDSISMPMLAIAGLIVVVVAVAGYMWWSSKKVVDGFEANSLSTNDAPTGDEDGDTPTKDPPTNEADVMTNEHPPE